MDHHNLDAMAEFTMENSAARATF